MDARRHDRLTPSRCLPCHGSDPVTPNAHNNMKINLQLLHLTAAIFNKDPLDMLIRWPLQTRDQLKENGQRLDTLRGVMPDSIFEQVLTFLAELVNNRGGTFQFLYTNDPKKINPAITKWTALISEDTSWLNDQVEARRK